MTDWPIHKLGDCVSLLSGGTPSKSRPDFWNGDTPWVSCKDMKSTRLFEAEDHLTELGTANGTRLVVSGTVLIVVRGMILADRVPVAMAMRGLAFNQDLKAFRCAGWIRDDFLFYWLLANEYLL